MILLLLYQILKSCCIVILHHPRCLNGMHYYARKNHTRLQFVQKIVM